MEDKVKNNFKGMGQMKAKNQEQLKEDRLDMKTAENRLKEIEKGHGIKSTKEEFLKEMKLWLKE